jgi:hypothetical protein
VHFSTSFEVTLSLFPSPPSQYLRNVSLCTSVLVLSFFLFFLGFSITSLALFLVTFVFSLIISICVSIRVVVVVPDSKSTLSNFNKTSSLLPCRLYFLLFSLHLCFSSVFYTSVSQKPKLPWKQNKTIDQFPNMIIETLAILWLWIKPKNWIWRFLVGCWQPSRSHMIVPTSSLRFFSLLYKYIHIYLCDAKKEACKVIQRLRELWGFCLTTQKSKDFVRFLFSWAWSGSRRWCVFISWWATHWR